MSATAHPHHHHHDADAFVEAVAQACATRGLRLTPLRRRVLVLFSGEDSPHDANDLLQRVMEEQSGAAAPTVYRALDFLLENHFIHKLESINSFVGCHHPSEAHQVPFLICDVCAAAIELCDDHVSSLLNAQARERGFRARAQTLEVHGVCASCTSDRAAARTHAAHA